MVSSITRSYSKENGLLGFLKGSIKGATAKEELPEGYSKLPSMSVPRPHLSAASLLPLWDLFQDDQSGLGVAVLKDGSYRCAFELDGVHVSGFDEVRLVSLMNHFTGFLNAIETSVQLTIVCHNISKREYFQRHPVEVTDDEFLKYVARVVENDEAFLLSKNFIPELKFYVTFCYRPPKEKKPTKQSWVERAVGNISDVFTNQASRQTVGSH